MFKRHKYLPVLVLVMLPLLYFQFVTTKTVSLNTLNEVERIEQLKRMNQYPRSFARLSNILEARNEIVVYYKLEKNFIGIFDLKYFFGGLWQPLLIPVFIVGLFELIRRHSTEAGVLAFPPVILTTFIGKDAYYGLIGFYPLIILSILFGLYKFSAFLNSHEK